MDYAPIKDSAEAARDAVSSSANTADTNQMTFVQRAQYAAYQCWDKVSDYMPDVSHVYIDPLSPNADITISDRFSLIGHNTQPWLSKFLSIKDFNIPPTSDLKTRVGHNIETYFYNYFILTVIHLIIFTIFHFIPILSAALLGALYYLLFVMYKNDITITENFDIDQTKKYIIFAIATVIAIIFGEILSILFSVAFFLLVVVGIHATFRDDETDDQPETA